MIPFDSHDRILLFDADGRFLAGDADGTEQTGRLEALGNLLGEEAAARFLAERADAKPQSATFGEVTLRWLNGAAGGVILAVVHRSPNEASRYRDAVTGLSDRRAIAAWAAARQANGVGSRRPYAALFIDLDHFKQVNDRHSHAAGDAVLAELAARWSAAVRDRDLVIRYGGDEFVILLDNVADRAAAEPIVGRLSRVTQQSIDWAGTPIEVAATIGVAVSDGSTPIEGLIAAADDDMYAQKRARAK